MNYFAHGYRFLDAPYFLAGTAVPDWLSVADRAARVRSKHCQPYMAHPDARTAALAAGIARHHFDDGWFHESTAFMELNGEFTERVRRLAADDHSLRANFLGHILVEILLDAALIEQSPGKLAAYYAALADVETGWVQDAVNRMAPRPARHLAAFIERFCQVRFLFDYADDVKLCYRLNQVLARVALPGLPDAFATVLPVARKLVARRMDELLAAPATPASGGAPTTAGGSPNPYHC